MGVLVDDQVVEAAVGVLDVVDVLELTVIMGALRSDRTRCYAYISCVIVAIGTMLILMLRHLVNTRLIQIYLFLNLVMVVLSYLRIQYCLMRFDRLSLEIRIQRRQEVHQASHLRSIVNNARRVESTVQLIVLFYIQYVLLFFVVYIHLKI